MTTSRSRPGRRAQAETRDARQDIIDAACLHFARFGIKGSSNRQIAADAGVTPAMIHYYFREREALHLAVLQSALLPLREALARTGNLREWVHCFHSHLLEKPWFPHLMIREVLTHDGQLRGLFLQHNAPHIFGSIKKAVQNEIGRRKAGRKLDIDRHVVLLMGMLVYPFLGMEIAQNITGRKFDSRMMQGFRDDALALFLHGITPDKRS